MVVIKSKGGEDNINKLLANEAQIGLAQLDTFAYMSSKKAEVNSELEIMGSLYQEAVYVVVNVDGKVRDEGDLQQKGVTIAVGKLGSGGASTWDYMRKLEPAFKGPAVDNSGGIRALGKLAAQPDGGINAVLFVTKPVMGSKLIQTVLDSEHLDFISITDMQLNNKYKPLGRPVYDFCKPELVKGFLNDRELKTICMDAVIVARSDADEDMLDTLADKILNYKGSLLK
jgi:TRAP-type uncharacterized transport system substrate-binding protein